MKPDDLTRDCPIWPPRGPPHLPTRLAGELEKFMRSGTGLVRWYAGKTRFVCGGGTRLVDVPGVWEGLVDEIKVAVREKRPTGHVTVRQAASRYYEYLDYRVATQQPKGLAAITAADYKRLIYDFGGTEMPGTARTFADIAVDELGPDHFGAYARTFAESAPASLGRAVAALKAFFAFCDDERIIAQVPHYGRYFRRPEQQKFRDRRLAQKKAFRPEEIWALDEGVPGCRALDPGQRPTVSARGGSQSTLKASY